METEVGAKVAATKIRVISNRLSRYVTLFRSLTHPQLARVIGLGQIPTFHRDVLSALQYFFCGLETQMLQQRTRTHAHV